MRLHKSQHDKNKPKHRRQKRRMMKAQALTNVFWANHESVDESCKTRVYKMIKEWKFLKPSNIKFDNNSQNVAPILSVYGVKDKIPNNISSNTIVVTKEGMVEMGLLKSVLCPSILEECTHLCREMSEWLATEKDIDKGSFFSGWWTLNMPMAYKCADSYRFETIDTKVKKIQSLLHDTYQHVLELANPKLFVKLTRLTERGQTPVVCFNMIPPTIDHSTKIENQICQATGKINRPKTNHLDRNDMGISVMFYMGKFGGGSLQLAQLNEKTPESIVHIQAGDVVILRANKYRHAVGQTTCHLISKHTTSTLGDESKSFIPSTNTFLPFNNIIDDGLKQLLNNHDGNSSFLGNNEQSLSSSTLPSTLLDEQVLHEQKRFSFIFFAHRMHFKHPRAYCELSQTQALNAFKADNPHYQSQRMKMKLKREQGSDEECRESLILSGKRQVRKRNYALLDDCGDKLEDELDSSIGYHHYHEEDDDSWMGENSDYENYEPRPTVEEYPIKAIIDHVKCFKGDEKSRKSFLYHIQWLGYPDETWEPFEHLDDCQVFEDYLLKHGISLYDEEVVNHVAVVDDCDDNDEVVNCVETKLVNHPEGDNITIESLLL